MQFVARLRGQVKYTGVEALIEQMELDVERAEEMLGVA
ncbi:riboflavin kinase [Tessaracoccus terricola]